MDIDAIIAEATKVAPAAQASPEASAETPVTNEPEITETPQPEIKPDNELTAAELSKREANRKSHLDSKLAKMRRENRELREAVERVSKAQAPTASPQVPNGAPQEKDFANYGDFIRAEARWEAQQEITKAFSERDTKAQEASKTQAFTAHQEKRISEITAEATAFAKTNPEYVALFKEHADYMEELPNSIENALLEAENPNLALFALMKEGKLEGLEDLSPYRLAMEIGKAELRGESYLGQNRATNAPTPLNAVKGTGNSSKALIDKSVEELMKQFNHR